MTLFFICEYKSSDIHKEYFFSSVNFFFFLWACCSTQRDNLFHKEGMWCCLKFRKRLGIFQFTYFVLKQLPYASYQLTHGGKNVVYVGSFEKFKVLFHTVFEHPSGCPSSREQLLSLRQKKTSAEYFLQFHISPSQRCKKIWLKQSSVQDWFT